MTEEVLAAAHRLAGEWLGTLAERPVRAAGEPEGLRAPLPDEGEDPVPIWAALRELGRRGLADMVERHCVLAARIAERLAAVDRVAVLNDVVLNQALVRFGDDDARTDAVIARVQAEGEAWLGGTRWHGMAAMRVSVSGWRTTEADADRTADAIAAAWAAVG